MKILEHLVEWIHDAFFDGKVFILYIIGILFVIIKAYQVLVGILLIGGLSIDQYQIPLMNGDIGNDGIAILGDGRSSLYRRVVRFGRAIMMK